MKLDIIAYKRVHKIRIAMPVLIYILVIVILLSYNSSAALWIRILKNAVLFILIGFGILNLLFSYHKKIGSLILKKNGECCIELDNKSIPVIINSIKLLYGGYNGEVHIYEAVIIFSNGRDGTCNYLIINDVEYQILLNNKEDWNNIKMIMNALHDTGVRSDCIIMTFREVLFRTIFKKGIRSQ